jgi:hypothetical protein
MLKTRSSKRTQSRICLGAQKDNYASGFILKDALRSYEFDAANRPAKGKWGQMTFNSLHSYPQFAPCLTKN